ncbi:sensor histidine kinase [Sphaerotilus mobilis]|uniref:histidine kinase n=1 Tax=Sphaerotilus mobilis TaxID=47994 RepID=A0A4Q7LLH5_9BURK|nr:histidine kinase [Sphaerotilus mobilis]RZS54448.1 two-component system sensor histidine kinase UhpB [Sphaerotilus mobilis]
MVSLTATPDPAPPAATLAAPATSAGRSLRFKVQVLLGVLMLGFVSALLLLQIQATRNSVHEEIVAGNRVAGQLLQRVGWVYRLSGPDGMLDFLQQLGRVRANEITLVDAGGRLIYRSPPSVYKQGREAPPWFDAQVAPPPQLQVIELPGGGRLTVEADASRAILDGWDDLQRLAAIGGIALLLINALVFWYVGVTLRPFATILAGLGRLERGDYAARLPDLPGREAGSIGAAINRMAAAVEDQLQTRLAAYEAERSLAESREIAHQVELHTERERREIARELHDELGQSVTAMRSLALSLTHRLAERDPPAGATATLIADEAGRLYDVMHGLIPRLTPLALDSLGLADALADLAGGARQHPGAPRIELTVTPLPGDLDNDLALAAYRVVQEALNNALRHSGATLLHIGVGLVDGAAGQRLQVQVDDNGQGLPPDWQRPGHYGLRGLRERVRSLGGTLAVEAALPGAAHPGVRIAASLPVRPVTPVATAERAR